MSQILDMQVYALLARVHAEQAEGCRRIGEEAAEQAAALVAAARSRARSQLKAAVAEKRRRVEEHCRRVRVEVESIERARCFAELGEWLSRAVESLPAALARRWQQPATRRQWWESALAGATETLGRGEWRIELAAGLDAAERARLVEHAREAAGGGIELAEQASLEAGLRISRGNACYDATLAGLTADRGRIEAALLAELGGAAGERGGA